MTRKVRRSSTSTSRGRTRDDPKFYVFCCPQVPQGRGRPRDDSKSLSSVVRNSSR